MSLPPTASQSSEFEASNTKKLEDEKRRRCEGSRISVESIHSSERLANLLKINEIGEAGRLVTKIEMDSPESGKLAKKYEMGGPQAGMMMKKVETGGMKVGELVKKIQMDEPKDGKVWRLAHLVKRRT